MSFWDKYRKFIDEDKNEIDSLDENSDTVGKKKKWGILNKLTALVLTFSVSLMGYNTFILYCLGRNKLFSEDNLFTGNYFSEDISDEEIDKYVQVLEEKLGCEIIDANKDEYCLLNAVLENKVLTESEREEFYKCIDLILDNPYLDKEMVYHSLRNVTIHNWLFRPTGVSDTTQGDYNYKNGIIRIFEKNEGNTIDHEKIHCIFSNENTANLPEYFDEGMTELLNNEYFSENPFLELSNYPFEVSAVKLLCDLTSSDTVLRAYTFGDMGIISEELARICDSDIQEAEEALNCLDLTFQNFKSGEDLNIEEAKICFAISTEYFDRCITKLDKKDSRRISYFYNIILLLDMFSEKPYDAYVDDLVEFGCDHKAYFSSKLKESLKEEETKILTK